RSVRYSGFIDATCRQPVWASAGHFETPNHGRFGASYSLAKRLRYETQRAIHTRDRARELSFDQAAITESARAPVVHSDGAAAERLRRDQLEPSRAGQPALVQDRAVAGDPGVDEELVLVDQIQPVQLGCELAATEEHAGRGRVFELLHARAQVAGN